MPRLHTYFTIFLSGVAAASLAYAWQLHDQLIAAEASRAVATVEQARLQKRVTTLEKTSAAPRSSLRAAAATSNDGPPDQAGGRDRFNQFAAMRDSAEARTLMAMAQRSALDGHYASLFKKLNLSPADLDRFKNLLVEKQAAAGDVMAAARSQGLNPRDNRDQIRDLITAAETETDATIRSTLGDAAFAQYQQYEQTLPERNVVNQLEQRLSYSSAPMADAQTEQLINLIAATAPARDPNANPALFAPPGGGGFGGRGGGGTTITDAVVAQAQSILSAPQVDALKQLQQDQATAAALRQQLRNRATASSTSTPAPAAPGKP